MDSSALLSAVATDESSLDWYRLPILLATAFVVLGLIVEYKPLLQKLHWNHFDPELAWEFVGGTIVTLAITAEVVLTFFAAKAETRLRTDNRQYVSLLEASTEELRSKNLALEKEVAPRDLSDDEIAKIINELKPFSGRELLVQSYFADTEGHRYLFVVSQTLGLAGLKPTGGYWYPANGPGLDFLLGMEIQAPPEQSDFADALQRAFSGTNSGVRYRWFPMAAGTPVTIHIGVKPFPIPRLAAPAGGNP